MGADREAGLAGGRAGSTPGSGYPTHPGSRQGAPGRRGQLWGCLLPTAAPCSLISLQTAYPPGGDTTPPLLPVASSPCRPLWPWHLTLVPSLQAPRLTTPPRQHQIRRAPSDPIHLALSSVPSHLSTSTLSIQSTIRLHSTSSSKFKPGPPPHLLSGVSFQATLNVLYTCLTQP